MSFRACCAWRTSELLADEEEDCEPCPEDMDELPWSCDEVADCWSLDVPDDCEEDEGVEDCEDCDDEGEEDCEDCDDGEEEDCDDGLEEDEELPCASATEESDRMAAAMAVFWNFMVYSFRFRRLCDDGRARGHDVIARARPERWELQ